MENGDRKDTEFEKPVVVNTDDINDLNKEQREQLNDIMRKSQLDQVKNANNEDINDEDQDVFVAKKVFGFASIPSQDIIGMKKKRKSKFRFNKKQKSKTNIKAGDTSQKILGKRKLLSHEEEDGDNEDNQEPSQKKRKIYQEMSKNQVKKQRKKKLKFKTDANDNINTANIAKQAQSSMLSFDMDDD